MSSLGLAGLVGLVLCVGAYAASAAMLLRRRRSGQGQRIVGFAPPVSILKPLAGLDEGLEENLESFFRLDYETYELIFSFRSPDDPAYAIARRAADRHAAVPSVFVFDPRDPGGNAKVNRLAAAARHARHRLLLFSDGNVRVRPDFLRRATSWFADVRVGLVSHLFVATGGESIGSRIEALYLNGCLQGGIALVADLLRMPCVVGKSILVSRPALDTIGGIGVLRDHLAEDFLLGRAVRRAGYRVELSGDVLDTSEVHKGLRAVWARHRRWAMMRRRLGGPLYLGEALTSPLPWFLAAIAGGSRSCVAVAGALLLVRYALEAALARRVGRPLAVRDLGLLPLRDAGTAAVFLAGLIGRSVSWRGRPMRIGHDTLIVSRAA